jgi:tetratricopeptide (TPR) repeat protein
VPITRYCDEHRLTPQQRLELFVPVCQAVQHAHQKGIIHRDLKPSNVLVCLYDDKPVPKVIDFGIAKAAGPRLTEKTLFTELGQVVGTLEYVSPEQAELNQLDIDTRSDIYSLGVLLYELLTGTTPLERKRLRAAAFLEVLRLIREEEPPRPSTRLSTTEELPSVAANRGLEPEKLSGLVRGELDWIVMKALEKDRNRRYETANGFVADVQRYLADEPVQACPPSAGYRLKKLARRNRVALTTATLIPVTLVLGTAVSTWQTFRATAAEHLAGERLTTEQQAQAALSAARDAKDQQRSRINGDLSQTLVEAGRLRDKVRTAPSRPGDGDQRARLRELSQRADALAGNELAEPALVNEVQALLRELQQEETNRLMAARLEKVRLTRPYEENPKFRINLQEQGAGQDTYAVAFGDYGIPAEELEVAEAARRIKASAIRDTLGAALDDWAGYNSGNQNTNQKLLLVAQGVVEDPWRQKYFDARLHNYAALRQLARAPEALAQPPATLSMLARSLNNVINRQTALELLRQAQVRHPSDVPINYELATALGRLPEGRSLEEAAVYYRIVLALRPDNWEILVQLGARLLESGRTDEALPVYREAFRRQSYAHHGRLLGGALLSNGARNDLDDAITLFRDILSRHPDWWHGERIQLGMALRQQGALDDAVTEFKEAIRLAKADTAPNGPDNVATAQAGLGWALEGKPEDSLASYRQAIRARPDDALAHARLDAALSRQGTNLDEAVAACQEAVRRQPGFAEAQTLFDSTLLQRKERDETIARLRESLRNNPDNDTIRGELGRELIKARKLDEAIRLKPEVTWLPTLCDALSAVAGGLLDQAIADCREAVGRRPDDLLRAFLGIALDRRRLRDSDRRAAPDEEALSLFAPWIRVEPKNPNPLLARGLVYRTQGAALASRWRATPRPPAPWIVPSESTASPPRRDPTPRETRPSSRTAGLSWPGPLAPTQRAALPCPASWPQGRRSAPSRPAPTR